MLAFRLDRRLTLRTMLLYSHILGAGAWFGANIMQGVIGPRLTADRAAALPWLRAVQKASGPLYGTASVVVLVTGVLMVVQSDVFGFDSGFVGVGFAAVIVGGALAGLVFTPKTRAMIGLLEAGEFEKVAPVYRTLGTWALVDTLVLLVAILAMVAKWAA